LGWQKNLQNSVCFLTTFNHQRFTEATPCTPKIGMSPQNFWGWIVKIWLKIGASGSNLAKRFHATCDNTHIDLVNIHEDNLGTTLYNMGGQKNCQNSVRFPTRLDFDYIYLRNGRTRRKSVKQLINYNSSDIGRKKLVNFGPLSKSYSHSIYIWYILIPEGLTQCYCYLPHNASHRTQP